MRPVTARLAAGLLLALGATGLQAQTVACHLSYGGETRIVETGPTDSPYTGAPTAIGSFFLFRIMFMREPADLARINLYLHTALGEAPIPLQHTSYAYPVTNQSRYGFTGLQRVYEPKRESELLYWCEIRPPPLSRPRANEAPAPARRLGRLPRHPGYRRAANPDLCG